MKRVATGVAVAEKLIAVLPVTRSTAVRSVVEEGPSDQRVLDSYAVPFALGTSSKTGCALCWLCSSKIMRE